MVDVSSLGSFHNCYNLTSSKWSPRLLSIALQISTATATASVETTGNFERHFLQTFPHPHGGPILWEIEITSKALPSGTLKLHGSRGDQLQENVHSTSPRDRDLQILPRTLRFYPASNLGIPQSPHASAERSRNLEQRKT